MSLSQIIANKIQAQIDALREKQANCTADQRAAIQAQIRALQSKLDAILK